MRQKASIASGPRFIRWTVEWSTGIDSKQPRGTGGNCSRNPVSESIGEKEARFSGFCGKKKSEGLLQLLLICQFFFVEFDLV
jgi:hypothetical protein